MPATAPPPARRAPARAPRPRPASPPAARPMRIARTTDSCSVSALLKSAVYFASAFPSATLTISARVSVIARRSPALTPSRFFLSST
jgi:hypothetical protein